MRLKAYYNFHITRLFYHPLAFLRSFVNVFRNIEETKTERTLRQFLKRFNFKKKRFSGITSPGKTDLNAYPYDETATMKILMQKKSHSAYGHSLLKTMRLMSERFFKSKKSDRK